VTLDYRHKFPSEKRQLPFDFGRYKLAAGDLIVGDPTLTVTGGVTVDSFTVEGQKVVIALVTGATGGEVRCEVTTQQGATLVLAATIDVRSDLN